MQTCNKNNFETDLFQWCFRVERHLNWSAWKVGKESQRKNLPIAGPIRLFEERFRAQVCIPRRNAQTIRLRLFAFELVCLFSRKLQARRVVYSHSIIGYFQRLSFGTRGISCNDARWQPAGASHRICRSNIKTGDHRPAITKTSLNVSEIRSQVSDTEKSFAAYPPLIYNGFRLFTWSLRVW